MRHRTLASSSCGMPHPTRKSFFPLLASAGLVLVIGWWTYPRSGGSNLSSSERRTRIRDAELETERGHPAAALETLEPLLTADQTEPRVWAAAGRAYMALQKPSAAVAAFDRIREDSDSNESWTTTRLPLAQALLQENDWDRALHALEEATKQQPQDLAALEELRWLNFNLLRPRDAVRGLHRKLAAGELQALVDLLDTQQRQPVPQESVRTLEEIDRKRPGQPAVLAALGRCRWHLGDLAEAQRLLIQALQQRPGDTHIRLTLAEFLLEQGEFDEAEKTLDLSGIEGSSAKPPAWEADDQYWLLRSQVEERRGETETALASLDRGIALAAPRLDLMTRRATLLRLLKRDAEVREASRALERSAAATRELAALVDAGKHHNPTHADAVQFARLCDSLGRSAEGQGWTVIAARLAELNRNGR